MVDRPTLVIGYGSALRRDDVAGRLVADAIAAQRMPGVGVITTTQLVPELVEPIADAQLVVFVDASIDVTEVTTTVVATARARGDSHHSTPASLLALAASLHGRRPRGELVEVPASDLSIGEGLSDAASAAVPIAIERIIELLTTFTDR